MLNQRTILIAASFSGMLAVALGAFGAHALKELLVINNRLDTFELASRYHFYHTLALLAIGLLMEKNISNHIKMGATLILWGMILFSGSLYVLSLTNITKFAIITPFGGAVMIAGWISVMISFYKSRGQN